MCKAIDNPTTGNDTFAKLYGAANIYYNHSGTATCFDLADDSDPHGLGGWQWQVCDSTPDYTLKSVLQPRLLFFFFFFNFNFL